MSEVYIPVAICAVSLGLGYYCALRPDHKPANSEPQGPEVVLEEDPQSIPDGDLSAIKASFIDSCKLVLVVRTDLKLPDASIYTLCSQATLNCYKALVKKNAKLVKHWETTGQAKIALRAKGSDQIGELEAIAKSLNLCARTVYKDDAPAVLGIGPAPVNLVNEVTGKLRLL